MSFTYAGKYYSRVFVLIAEGTGLVARELGQKVVAVSRQYPGRSLFICTGKKSAGSNWVSITDFQGNPRTVRNRCEALVLVNPLIQSGVAWDDVLLEVDSDNTDDQVKLLGSILSTLPSEDIILCCHDIHLDRVREHFARAGVTTPYHICVAYRADPFGVPLRTLWHLWLPRFLYYPLEQLQLWRYRNLRI